MLNQSPDPRQVFALLLSVLEAAQVGKAKTFWCFFSQLNQDWAMKSKPSHQVRIRHLYSQRRPTTLKDKFFARPGSGRLPVELLRQHLEPVLNTTTCSRLSECRCTS